MKVQTVLVSMFLLFAAATSAFAACDTTLKPTDNYQVLAGKLECLNSRIVALEKLVGSASPVAAKPPLSSPVNLKSGVFIGATSRCGSFDSGITGYFTLENLITGLPPHKIA